VGLTEGESQAPHRPVKLSGPMTEGEIRKRVAVPYGMARAGLDPPRRPLS
jgi:hypothetical protein